jgi:hypothetical protein
MLTAEGSSRFFALSEKSANLAAEWDRRATVISQGDSAEEIEPIAALEAEMEQNERYLATAP